MNKMAVNNDMFTMIMLNRLDGHVRSTDIVTIYLSRAKKVDAEIT